MVWAFKIQRSNCLDFGCSLFSYPTVAVLYSLNADIETQIVLTFYLFQDRGGIMYVRRQVKSII